MKTDLLQQYSSIRMSLEHEREELLTRLRQIEQALGALPSQTAVGATGRRGRRGNPMPLRDAVLHVTANRALTKEEIVEAVQRLGYRFTGKDPLNVVGVIVYGKNPAFRNDGGRFSSIGGDKIPPIGRTMSAAARARVAAAQRARWTRQKAAGNGVRKPKPQMTAESRARIIAAAKARRARERAARE